MQGHVIIRKCKIFRNYKFVPMGLPEQVEVAEVLKRFAPNSSKEQSLFMKSLLAIPPGSFIGLCQQRGGSKVGGFLLLSENGPDVSFMQDRDIGWFARVREVWTIEEKHFDYQTVEGVGSKEEALRPAAEERPGASL